VRRFVAVLLFAVSAARGLPQQATLFSQAAAAELRQRFGGGDVSWLLLDRSGIVQDARWDERRGQPSLDAQSHPLDAQSPGSLVKPFLAMAYAAQHGGVFPRVRCTGTAGRCWLPEGHGALDLEEAIAQSCNAYFLALAAGLDRRTAAPVFAHYGLRGPPPTASDATSIGLGSEWKESPLALARAYLQLESEAGQPTQARLRAGMLAAASRGTAWAVDQALGPNAALAKTGTAPCAHQPRAAADGFALVLYPATQPRLLLLVRKHGATGAATAALAAQMLRSLGMGQP
jgi:cell division protein FtsI/penicillin-binding protein 2